MGYTLATSSEKSHRANTGCTKKSASREFFTPNRNEHCENPLKTLNPQQGKTTTLTKTALGRTNWLGRDPIEENGGINLYAFVGNMPLKKWDRLGLDDKSIIIDSVVYGDPNTPPVLVDLSSIKDNGSGGWGRASMMDREVTCSCNKEGETCQVHCTVTMTAVIELTNKRPLNSDGTLAKKTPNRGEVYGHEQQHIVGFNSRAKDLVDKLDKKTGLYTAPKKCQKQAKWAQEYFQEKLDALEMRHGHGREGDDPKKRGGVSPKGDHIPGNDWGFD